MARAAGKKPLKSSSDFPRHAHRVDGMANQRGARNCCPDWRQGPAASSSRWLGTMGLDLFRCEDPAALARQLAALAREEA